MIADVDVRVICAIGRSGQLGLKGLLPWEGDTRRPFVEDVERFFEISRGHVLVAGPTTAQAVPDFAKATRTVVAIRSHEDPREVLSRYRGRTVFVGGGPRVWDVYAPFVRHWDVNVLPYDGEADRWFDPAWLVAGGRGRG